MWNQLNGNSKKSNYSEYDLSLNGSELFNNSEVISLQNYILCP